MAVAGCNATKVLPAVPFRPSVSSCVAGTACTLWGKKATLHYFAVSSGQLPSHGFLPRGHGLYRKGAHLSHNGISTLALGGEDSEIVTVTELGDGTTLYTFDSSPSHHTPSPASRAKSAATTVRLTSTFQKRSPIPVPSKTLAQQESNPPLPPQAHSSPTVPHRPHSNFTKRSPITVAKERTSDNVLSSSPPPSESGGDDGFFSSNNGALASSSRPSRPPSRFTRLSPIPPEARRATRGRIESLSASTRTKTDSAALSAKTTQSIAASSRVPSGFVRRSPIPPPPGGVVVGVRPVPSLGGPAFQAARLQATAAVIAVEDEAEVTESKEVKEEEEEAVPKKATRRGRKRAVDGGSNGVVMMAAAEGETAAAKPKAGRGRGRRKAVEKIAVDKGGVESSVLKHPLPSRPLASSFVRRSPIPAKTPLREVPKKEDVTVAVEGEVKVKKRRGRKPASAGALSPEGAIRLANSNAPNLEPEYLSLLDSTNAKLREMAKARGIRRWSMMQKMELIQHILEVDYPGKFTL